MLPNNENVIIITPPPKSTQKGHGREHVTDIIAVAKATVNKHILRFERRTACLLSVICVFSETVPHPKAQCKQTAQP